MWSPLPRQWTVSIRSWRFSSGTVGSVKRAGGRTKKKKNRVCKNQSVMINNNNYNNRAASVGNAGNRSTHRTSAVAHSDVALDVKRRRSGESKRLHVSEHLSLEHLALTPRSSKTADQFVVDRTSEKSIIT